MRIIFIDDINRMERFINISYYVNTGTGGMNIIGKRRMSRGHAGFFSAA